MSDVRCIAAYVEYIMQDHIAKGLQRRKRQRGSQSQKSAMSCVSGRLGGQAHTHTKDTSQMKYLSLS